MRKRVWRAGSAGRATAPECREYDGLLIHEKYRHVVEAAESAAGELRRSFCFGTEPGDHPRFGFEQGSGKVVSVESPHGDLT